MPAIKVLKIKKKNGKSKKTLYKTNVYNAKKVTYASRNSKCTKQSAKGHHR